MGVIVPQGAGSGGGRAQLVAFREDWYSCLGRRADALFELTDALLCGDGPVTSFPYLSLEPEFRRGWGSGYAALARRQSPTAVASTSIRNSGQARAATPTSVLAGR